MIMGSIELDSEPAHKRFLRRVLRRRGLKPVTDTTWEVHGPHPPGMRHHVYFGPASLLEKDVKADILQVAVYVFPRKDGGCLTHVYLMPDGAEWWHSSGRHLTETDHDEILAEWV
jgi:hypothetical protein